MIKIKFHFQTRAKFSEIGRKVWTRNKVEPWMFCNIIYLWEIDLEFFNISHQSSTKHMNVFIYMHKHICTHIVSVGDDNVQFIVGAQAFFDVVVFSLQMYSATSISFFCYFFSLFNPIYLCSMLGRFPYSDQHFLFVSLLFFNILLVWRKLPTY